MVCSGGERPSSGLHTKRGNINPFESLSHVAYHFSTSGLAVATETGFTHPPDVVKVRLQMQLVGQRGHLDGMGKVFVQMLKVEGPKALYLGLGPTLILSLLYGGLRLGLYGPCKYVCDLSFGSANVFVKLAAGAFSGTIATAFTNPAEVLKVRLQMNSNGWGSTFKLMKKIVSEEGLKALWKGVGPAMTRAAALTASQLATYDESKQVVHTEGPLALYKGGFAIFARLGPQTTITFLVCEKLRELAGMRAI